MARDKKKETRQVTFVVAQRENNADSNWDKNTGGNEKMRSDSVLSTELEGFGRNYLCEITQEIRDES